MTKVVVGTDGSPHAQAALEWALDEAHAHGDAVVLVNVYPPPLYYTAYGAAQFETWDEEMRAHAATMFDTIIDSVGDKAAGVSIERIAVCDQQPARALLEQAKDARMLVVGSRGRGGFAGLLLGSVSQVCTQHATCPTVIVPSGP
jgi:nucleotide-binding universal stress UspA family protein